MVSGKYVLLSIDVGMKIMAPNVDILLEDEQFKMLFLDAGKFQKRWMLFESLWAPLGWFWVLFCTPLDFEGGPKVEVLDIEANEMRKKGVPDRVLIKQEFQRIFYAPIQGPDLVKNEFGRRRFEI